jgi:transcriptional antiterminator NusG
MIEKKDTGGTHIKSKLSFEVGDYVEVISGSFAGQSGKVTLIKEDKGQVYIEGEMFGKKTEVPVSIIDVKIK